MSRAASVTVRVPAKVNLQLSVGPPRPDGYHGLVSVFHAISVWDVVTVLPTPPGAGPVIEVVGDGAAGVPTDRSNLAWRAAEALAAELLRPADVAIRIAKGIPVAGGMAGGSADAAAVLVGCDALWGAETPRDRLDDIAAQLGSDVPFALHGGTAVGTSRGEVLLPVLAAGEFHWVVAIADGGLSTPAVYRAYDSLRPDARAPELSEPLMQALRAGDAEGLGRSLANDLQPAAISLRPALARTLEAGRQEGALGAIVSGSGPTCVFLARCAEHALDLAVGLAASGTCRSVLRAQGPVPGARIDPTAASGP